MSPSDGQALYGDDQHNSRTESTSSGAANMDARGDDAPTPGSSSSHHTTSPSQGRTPASTTPRSAGHRADHTDDAADRADAPQPSGSGAGTAAVPLAGKRSRSGCLTCRKRKKKCDETLCVETGGCWRCRNAGYRCEGFRRAPVTFEPGTTTTSKSKRIKIASPDDSNPRVKTEPASSTSQLADFEHEARQADGMAMPNSLAQFAGLATSTAAWPMVNGLAPAPTTTTTKADAKPPISYKNGTPTSPPSTFSSFVHPSAMLPPPPRSPLRSAHDHEPIRPPPAATSAFYAASSYVACEIVGDCLFSGRHLCASCSAVANRLMQPDPAQLAAMDADLVQVQPMPSLSTPMASRPHSPAPHAAPDANGASQASAKSKLVMESLIGYYSTLITCWTQGCDVRGLEASTLFRQLVPYLLDSVDTNPPLRLSIAAVTAGYVGGARLTWPKDVVAIHQWANTLRGDRTSIADCVKANLSFPFPATPDTVWSASPSGSLSSETPAGASSLSPANAERLRRASTTHATLDDLLVGQAQTLKQLAVKSLEQAVADYRCKTATARAAGVGFTEKGFLAELKQVNPVLLAAMNIAIYAFAEEGMESYFEEAARMRALIDTLLGAFPPVDLAKLVSHELLGFRTYVWSDVSTAIACGTRPHLQLAKSTFATDADAVGTAEGTIERELDMAFGLQDASLIALSDIARLRYDYDGGDFSKTAQRAAGSAVPAWVHERAQRIQTRAESCRIETSLTTGSAICAMMTKSACVILIHTLIYRVGALHPVVRSLLRGMLELWTSAGEQYCRSVGCSNFNLPIFIAASVAVDEADRKVCEQAMQIVGHEEAGPAPGRELIREVWRRTDITGQPCFWTDLVATGDFAVAFF